METNNFTDFTNNYECKSCNIKCSRKTEWVRHIATRKHKNNGNGNSVFNGADVSAGSARIGYIYAYDSTNNPTHYTGGGTCNTFDNNFNTLVANIETERNGSSGITTFSNGSSNIRDKRVRELISIWAYQWQIRTNEEKIDQIDDALDQMDQLPPF